MNNPIGLYLGFNKSFFRKDEASEMYLELLNNNYTLLNNILLNECEPEDLPTSFYETIIKLTDVEVLLPDMLIKPPYQETEKTAEVEYFYNNIKSIEKGMGVRNSCHLVRLKYPFFYSYGGPNLWVGDYQKQLKVWEKNMQNTVCPAFADDFIEYYPEYDFYTQTYAMSIGGHDHGPFMFWTLAPYIHLDLKQRGVNAKDSIKKIMDWVVLSKPGHHNSDICEFDFCDFNHFGRYVLDHQLGLDERMPSHLRARVVSKVISRNL